MKRFIPTLALAAGGLLFAAGTADAQVRVPVRSSWINPWTPYANWGTTTYTPAYGITTQSYALNPYTGATAYQGNYVNPYGTLVYQQNYVNPYTGYYGNYSYGYNPYSNTYRYRVWNGRRGGWGGGYGW